jgi:hypothetical protein
MVSDEDELGLLSKGRPMTAKPRGAVTQTRDGFVCNKISFVFLVVLVAVEGLGGHGQPGRRLWKGMELFVVAPQAEQDDSQLAGHGNDSAFLAAVAA